MDKHFSDSDLNKIGLLRIFSDIDTQSAIVAAVVISVMTFLVTGFSNLCNYIYWNAYFTNFDIPLTYIGEAIIHENGIKYSIILIIPILILFWFLLSLIKSTAKKLFIEFQKKAKKTPCKSTKQNLTKGLKFIGAITLVFLLISVFILLLDYVNYDKCHIIIYILYFEMVIFVLWNISKANFGRRFSFSKKTYYTIRITSALIAIYLILGNVYLLGRLEHYNENGAQLLQIVNNPEVDFHSFNDTEDFHSQLILFETADHYYVTDITINYADGLNVTVWDNDSYCFVDKVGCPVKSIYARLKNIGNNRADFSINELYGLDIGASLISVIVFIALLSIPMSKDKKKKIETTNKS